MKSATYKGLQSTDSVGDALVLGNPPHLEFHHLDSGIAAHNRISGAICLLPTGETVVEEISNDKPADPIFNEQELADLNEAGLFNRTRHPFPVPVKFSKSDYHVSLVASFGDCSVKIECPEPEILDIFRSALGPVLVTDSAAPPGSDTISLQFHGDALGVFLNTRPVYGQCPFPLARHFLMREVAASLAGRGNVSATFHAGAVGTPTRAVVFPAGSGSGKSTLTAALSANGFLYYCDDQCALVGDEGRIAAFPTRIGLKRGSWAVADLEPYAIDGIDETFVGDGYIKQVLPEAIADSSSRPQLCAFVFPSYSDTAGFSLTELSKLDALQRLFNSGARLTGRYPTIKPLARALANVPAYELNYSRTQDAMDAVAGLLAE